MTATPNTKKCNDVGQVDFWMKISQQPKQQWLFGKSLATVNLLKYGDLLGDFSVPALGLKRRPVMLQAKIKKTSHLSVNYPTLE